MEKLTELAIRVFSDKYPDVQIQSIIVFAHTIDNYQSTLEKACEIYSESKVPIIISGAGSISGYVGCSKYKNTLLKLGVNRNDIIISEPVDSQILHTRNESQAYIQTLKEFQITNGFIISVPFHQVRAFMTMVSVAIEQNFNIKLYNCPVEKFDWNKTITHSQGILRKEARELIYEEFDRIKKYNNKGDLESVEAVLNYLNNRDLN